MLVECVLFIIIYCLVFGIYCLKMFSRRGRGVMFLFIEYRFFSVRNMVELCLELGF